jgi:hypothetical protein
MAVTEEFRQDVLEVLDGVTAQLENQSGTNATPIMPIEDVDKTVSMPAVKFDVDPRTNSRAVPQGYYQIPVSDFYALIDALAREVSVATDDLVTLKANTEAAAQTAVDSATACDEVTTASENVNVTLVGMTVTVTDRTGTSRSQNIGFEIFRTYKTRALMKADAANVPEGKFVMIGNTDDPTDPDNATLWSRTSAEASDPDNAFMFLSDLDQASSAAWADWLENMKPAIQQATADANTAAAAANAGATAANNAATAADNSRIAIEANEQTRQTAEQARVDAETQRQTDWTSFFSDSLTTGCRYLWNLFYNNAVTLWNGFWGESSTDPNGVRKQWADLKADAQADHQTATQDHQTATQDHQTATTDHQQYTTDHSTAGDDHTRAGIDHGIAEDDHTTAGNDHTASQTATGAANDAAALCAEWNAHPPFIGDGTYGYDENYWYIYDTATSAYVRSIYARGSNLDWSTMTPAEKQQLAQEVLSQIAFDDMPEEGSPNAVKSGGVYAALGTKAARVHSHKLEDLEDDATHRVVTDQQITAWNGKQDALVFATVLEAEAAAMELT